MIVRWKEQNEQGFVVLISWTKNHHQPATTQTCFWTGEALRYPHMDECEVLDRNLDNFLVMPDSFDSGRVHAIMFKPLFDAGIWEELVDYNLTAITKMKAIIPTHRL
jgi:hypothetical protein